MFRKIPQKSMAQYYDDLLKAVDDVRDAHPHADDDAAFMRAANVIDALVETCRDMETINPVFAQGKDAERKKLLNDIGDNRLPDVEGEASKMLAEKYHGLLKALYNKEYYPVEDCPKVGIWFGPSMRTEYDDNFDSRKPRMKEKMDELAKKIAAFEPTNTLRPAM
tara:strand:- start:1995 stop:2489 length:495 start_codon:yes stop_codon:yes gene_type:complete